MSNLVYDDYSHYDIGEMFEIIERDLMSNMRRNLIGHRQDEKAEGFNWSMWQAEKARSLQKFIKENEAILVDYESPINNNIESIMAEQFREGAKLVDREIIKAFGKGYFAQRSRNNDFFKLNERKIKSLIKAVQNDMLDAQSAALRKTNDVYRKVIFGAEMYAAAGTKTVNQCIDMATEDFYKKGVACIKYKNGTTVDVAKYAAMAIRTANKRAFLTGEGLKRDEWDEHLVYMSKYGRCSPTCLPYQGKVYIDDVFSHPTAEYIELYQNKGYTLLSKAIAGGAFHPNCKHTLSTFFEGVNSLPEEQEQEITEGLTAEEQKARQCQNMAEGWSRIALFSLDNGNKKEAKRKSEAYKSKADKFKNSGVNSVAKFVNGDIIKGEDIQIMRSVGAKAYQDEIKLLNGQKGKIAEGSKITKVYTFAGKGTSKPVKVAGFLSKEYKNVPEEEWKKVRGDGFVEYPDGSVRHCELHWFESKEAGRIKMKVKREFEDNEG